MSIIISQCPFLPQWSIKLHGGSSEALQQYKVNLTAIAVYLERLAERGQVYWVLQGEISSTEVRLVPFTTAVHLSFNHRIHGSEGHH